MAEKFPYPPCTPGPLSEKPRRHEFEIKLDVDDRALLRTVQGRIVYYTVCKYCGLNDPNPPRF